MHFMADGESLGCEMQTGSFVSQKSFLLLRGFKVSHYLTNITSVHTHE